jgi:hypothetical protein
VKIKSTSVRVSNTLQDTITVMCNIQTVNDCVERRTDPSNPGILCKTS